MRVNGKCYYSIVSGGGIVNGDAVPVAKAWSSPIDCLIKLQSRSDRGVYEDGKFTQTQYLVTLPMMEFNAKEVRLVTSRGIELGTFHVQNIQFLDTVQRVLLSL